MKDQKPIHTAPERSSEGRSQWESNVREQVRSLQFGTVLITGHDARVVQVEKLE